MRTLFLLSLIVLVSSCQNDTPKDYVTFSGKITNQNSDSLKVYTKNYSKVIAVNENGEFSDTLHVSPGVYRVYDGGEYAQVFLRNGYDLYMTLDTETFDESISFSGEGSANSNFIAQRALKQEELLEVDVEEHDTISLKKYFDEAEAKLMALTDNATDLDSIILADHQDRVKSTLKSYRGYYGSMVTLRLNLPEGTPSPTFENYENHAGGATSFNDLLGSYTYIDVWATWCGPCKAEIPHLKKLEADYHDKNIQFVSISIDKAEDHEKWIAMVNDKELGGVQLFADNDWNSQFIKDYYIKGIPRFILIDPEGNVISPDAPRPSDDKVREVLDGLL